MKIIIVGGGKVGLTLVEQLCAEGHDITLLDTNSQIVEDAVNKFDIQGIVGSGTSYKAQIEAGISSADILIAVTNNDETSLLSCLIAKKAGNCKTIARVRDPEYYAERQFLREELGMAMAINPDITVAGEIERLIQIPSALEVDTFAKGRATIIRIQIPPSSPLAGIKVSEISSKIPGKFLICIQEHENQINIPNGNTVLYGGDYISIMMPLYQARNILKKIGIEAKPVKSVMIAGGGNIAYYLSEMLSRGKQQIKIIEKDPQRCQFLSEHLPEAMIICGDATDEELLDEEGIHEVDAFISLTNFDEGNILMSLQANNVSKAKIITKISRVAFEKILNDLPIGTPVFSKKITVERIVRYVRAVANSEHYGEVITLYKLLGGKAEALELKVKKDSTTEKIIGTPLYKLKLRSNLIITCINKAGKIVIPDGQSIIDNNDTVIVVSTTGDSNKITCLADIFKKAN